jgi:2-desacetyl-2-hydroxyethyl bacteriochlorophyllide A dehydrogenase
MLQLNYKNRRKNMKCVAIKEAKKLEVKEVEDVTSKNGSVVIEVKKTGICGSDIHYWESGQPAGLIMGHEFCGTVIDKGSREDLNIGDRITALPISPCGHCDACKSGNVQYCLETWNDAVGLSLTNSGGFAEKLSVRPDMVIKVPDNVSDNEAAMVEPAAVGLHAIHLADIKVGSKVLVIGGGIIGLLCAEFAKMEGASYVAMTETNKARGQKALDLKVVDEYFDALDENLTTTLMTKTNGGFDIVIDCCGNSPAVSSGIMFTKTGGTLVLVGVSLNPITIPSVIGVMHELKIQGAIAYTVNEFQTCLDLISEKKLDILKFLDDIVPLEKVQESFERLTSGTDSAVKIIVDPTL